MLNNKGLHPFYPEVTRNSKGKKVVISEISNLKFECKYSHNLVSHGLSSKSQLFSEPPESAECCVLSPVPYNKDKAASRRHYAPSDTEMQSQITHQNLNSAAFPEQSFKSFNLVKIIHLGMTSSEIPHGILHNHWYSIGFSRNLVSAPKQK